jgi:hypothetical protein
MACARSHLHLPPDAAARCLQAGDSAAQKLGGALANAAIFIAIIAALTFGLVLLFKHGVRATQHTRRAEIGDG